MRRLYLRLRARYLRDRAGYLRDLAAESLDRYLADEDRSRQADQALTRIERRLAMVELPSVVIDGRVF